MKLIPIIAITATATAILSAGPALTIYNQDFAVVRDQVPLDLQKGENQITYSGATLQLEPDSVILRDPSRKTELRILEQSYRGDAVSKGLLLSLNEGREIDFLTTDPDGRDSIVRGKIIRSGFTPGLAAQRYQGGSGEEQTPIIEMNGQLRFTLPGEPLFPSLGADSILKPTLSWKLASDRAAKLDAELSYITGGLSWNAAYNFSAPEKGDTLDVVGWVTIANRSGKTFENSSLKLMAGDVSKLQASTEAKRDKASAPADPFADSGQVTEKAFDEFHLYSLPRAVTLRDEETKQVEFLRGTGIKATTLYIYNGAKLQLPQYRHNTEEYLRGQSDYGTQSNTKVAIMREFVNSKENGLGLPLPKGRTRFYRQDDADGRAEFIGENEIDHTPQGETCRIYTGDAFDIVGSRIRTDYKLENAGQQIDEAFEIRVRNRKEVPVEVRVTERLYRWFNWEIVEKSNEFTKTDSRNIEFRIALKPDEEKVLTYRVRYNWK